MLVEHAVRSAETTASAPPRLILVVDQFEDLFTAGEDTDAGRAEREAFIAALHAAATVPVGRHELPSALVIAAMRADFLGRLIAYPALRTVMDAGLFTVGPMSEAELRLAMTGPAAEAGLAVEPALVEAVISELRAGAAGGIGSGALPLMSQAMAATWERREGNKLTLRGYRRAGGVADAVNRGARAAFDALTGRQQDAARLVFTQLTVVMPDGRLVRRRCSRAELDLPGAATAADIDVVIDVFSAQRLLVLGQDSVEISHDVLLHAWTQLRDWLGDDQLDRALYSQIVTDAETWDVNRRDPSYLYRPGRLATIDAATTRWQDAPTRYPPLPAASTAFLRAAHHAASRSIRRRRGVIAGLLALTVIAISAAGVAANDAADASRQHLISLSRQLATESLIIDSGDPLTARQLAVAAWRVYPTDQAESVMTTLLTEQQRDGMVPGDPASGGATGAAFSPDGKLLAIAYGDGIVRLWNPATEQAVGAPLQAGTGTVSGAAAVAFSRNGKLLATADADGTVRVWNPAGGQAPLATYNGNAAVNGVAFGPDGKLLATADIDGAVRLWSTATGREVGAPLSDETGPGPGVNAVAFSPDGQLLASADADGTVRLWNPATEHAIGPGLPAENQQVSGVRHVPLKLDVSGVAFSPVGNLLASADADGTVRLWNTATEHAIGITFPADTGSEPSVNGVAFSPDGKLLASADGTVRVWNAATGRLVSSPLPGALYGVNGVAFSPDGELLATAGADGTVRLWNPATGQAIGHPMVAGTGTGGAVNGVAFSPNGNLLASADADGTVRLWNTVTEQAVGPPLAADLGYGVNGVAFSPDGELLASADADGTVRLWNTATERAIGTPLPADLGYAVTGVAFSPDGDLLASADADGTVQTWQMALFADPYVALCADVGSPTRADWTRYAPGEPQPDVCR